MSFWTRPLFGKRRVETPAGAVAIRCARIREGGSYESVRAAIAGYVVGSILFVGEISGAVEWQLSSARAGLPWKERLRVLFQQTQPWEAALTLVLVTAWLWSMPWFLRKLFDRRVGALTKERLARLRRHRRGLTRFLIWYGAVVVLATVVALLLGAGSAACFLPAKYCAACGGATVAVGVVGRTGSRLVCARCGYPMSTWHGAPERCPECGRDWRMPWGARFGERAVRWNWVSIGAGMIGASLALSVVAARWG
jgi:hypothetical protein